MRVVGESEKKGGRLLGRGRLIGHLRYLTEAFPIIDSVPNA